MPIAYLPDRGVVEISGEDRVAYLQGLISNDVAALAPGQAATPWCAVADLQAEAEQLWLLAEHPQLLPQLDLHSPLLQWMVAARRDSVEALLLERMPKTAALQQTLELARRRAGRGARA